MTITDTTSTRGLQSMLELGVYLSRIAEVRGVADQVNAIGPMDAVIHNAAVGFRERRRAETEDRLAHVFAVNTLAPYLLTAWIGRPARLVYVSSELHRRGDASLDDLNWERRPWRGNQAYSDTKLHVALLACAVARRWPGVRSNALEPGWVATRMGGPRATGDLQAAHLTQADGDRRGPAYRGDRRLLFPHAPEAAERRRARFGTARQAACLLRVPERRVPFGRGSTVAHGPWMIRPSQSQCCQDA